jgi:hypothetical protein
MDPDDTDPEKSQLGTALLIAIVIIIFIILFVIVRKMAGVFG